MAKRADKHEAWCRKNISSEESQKFWAHWCETQWGMPDFVTMRLCIETYRKVTTA